MSYNSSFLPKAVSSNSPNPFGTVDLADNTPLLPKIPQSNINGNRLEEVSKGIYKLKPSFPKKTIQTQIYEIPSKPFNPPEAIEENLPDLQDFSGFDDDFLNSLDIPEGQKSPFDMAHFDFFSSPQETTVSNLMEEDNNASDSDIFIPTEDNSWYYQKDISGEEIPFSNESNSLINRAHTVGKSHMTFFDTTLGPITVYFDSMAVHVTADNETYHLQCRTKAVNQIPVNRFNTEQVFKIQYPNEWESQSNICELKQVLPGSLEFNRIRDEIYKTVPRTARISIQRIQNQHLWRRYFFERQFVAEKNGGISNEMDLFHGTRSTRPVEIYNGEEGFDMRHSKTGMWGVGIYFASSASYSLNYAYDDSLTNSKQFIFSKVAVGSPYVCIKGDTSLRTPPQKQETQISRSKIPFAIDFYDSVVGIIGKSKIFTVYSNSKAYPSYLISIQLPGPIPNI